MKIGLSLSLKVTPFSFLTPRENVNKHSDNMGIQ